MELEISPMSKFSTYTTRTYTLCHSGSYHTCIIVGNFSELFRLAFGIINQFTWKYFMLCMIVIIQIIKFKHRQLRTIFQSNAYQNCTRMTIYTLIMITRMMR